MSDHIKVRSQVDEDKEQIPSRKSANEIKKLFPEGGDDVHLSVHDSSDQESMDRQQLLLMEIKQLKRENNFLKKKINDLTHQLEERENIKKNKIKSKKSKMFEFASDDKSEHVRLSVDLFFKEVANLLQRVNQVFRLTEKKITNSSDEEDMDEYKRNPLPSVGDEKGKTNITKKDVLNKKLERIILQSQENRYQMLLQLFMQYYKAKAQSQKKMIKLVDDLTRSTIQMNRKMLQRGQSKHSIKTSQISSVALDLGDKMTMPHFGRPSATITQYFTKAKVDTQQG